jgi:glycine/D-amino acid oxidase-like deaminating enzyme
MDLRSNNPYWLLRHGIRNVFPSLRENQHADITVIGAGITGALITYHLCKAGFSVNVVDKRHAGFGSTAACTGLLQYEIDVPLSDLITKVGSGNAVRSYELCRASLVSLKKITDSLKTDTGFREVPSLQFASYKSHRKKLQLEYDTRKKYDLCDLDWLESEDVNRLFGFEAPAAILSEPGATVDAYAFTHELLTRSIETGAVKVYDHTLIKSIHHGKKSVTVTSAEGRKLSSRYLIIACGYESQKYLSKQVEIPNSTYAIISEPLEKQTVWHKNAMIWETADPYLYMCITDDNRISVGGKDDKFYNPDKRDGKLSGKAASLKKSFCKLFPFIDFRIDFSWAGYFSKSKDGLPYIGAVSERPHTYFALGFGGNGINFSVIAAELITDVLTGKENHDLSLFSLER